MKISKILPKIYIPRSEKVYYPSDDSYLFLDYLDSDHFKDSVKDFLSKITNLKQKKEINILEMGCGTGILGFFLIYKLINLIELEKISIVLTDINPESIRITKKMFEENKLYLEHSIASKNENLVLNIKYCVSNLFENITNDENFDIVLFNPPYLPNEPELININTKKEIDHSWDGGSETGNKILLDFIFQLKNHIFTHSNIYFITSSHSDVKSLLKAIKILGYSVTLLSSVHIFFEDIILFKCNQNNIDI
ncbi:MAG: methyltransferase [archaeon]|nr:methyltransferase [archaeon]